MDSLVRLCVTSDVTCYSPINKNKVMEETKDVVFKDFSQEPVQVINLEQLGKTHMENYPDGTPVGGIYHVDFINRIYDELLDAGLLPEIQEIFVANNKFKRSPGITILREVVQREGVGSCASHIVRRVFCNINLGGVRGTEDMCYNVAISYTQLGIVVGFGPFVYACKNQTICNAERMISNYTVRGYNRLTTEARSIDYLLTKIKEMIIQIESWQQFDFHFMEMCSEYHFTEAQVREFVGMLTLQHAASTSANPLVYQNKISPLSIAHINMVADKILDEKLDKGCTAYDIMQACNFYMKPKEMPFETITPRALALTTALKNFMQIDL